MINISPRTLGQYRSHHNDASDNLVTHPILSPYLTYVEFDTSPETRSHHGLVRGVFPLPFVCHNHIRAPPGGGGEVTRLAQERWR